MGLRGGLLGLDLGLLVDGQQHSLGGRVHVEADHILHILGKGQVVRALERSDPMRSQAMLLPNPLHGAQGDPDSRGDGRSGPVRDLVGLLREGQCQNFRHRPGGVRRDPRLASFVAQHACDILLGKTLPSASGGGLTDADLPRHVLQAQALG